MEPFIRSPLLSSSSAASSSRLPHAMAYGEKHDQCSSNQLLFPISLLLLLHLVVVECKSSESADDTKTSLLPVGITTWVAALLYPSQFIPLSILFMCSRKKDQSNSSYTHSVNDRDACGFSRVACSHYSRARSKRLVKRREEEKQFLRRHSQLREPRSQNRATKE